MSINWFPGHMNKARRQLQERAAKSDMVLEVLDARIPRSSQNPMLARWCAGLPTLRVLTKPDLADPQVTSSWLEVLAEGQIKTLALVANQPGGAKKLVQACRKLVPSRGQPGFPVRVMIAGIPNVGKSTIFNLLVGKRKAIVRDQPAVTRREQRIEVPGGLELVDTPGVLWPKLADQAGAHRLAASGAIRETAYDPLLVARFLADWLRRAHPLVLRTRFKLTALPEDPDALLTLIARKRGCLTRGVGPDLGKVSDVLLGELRSGKLGRLSLETPDDFPAPGSHESETEGSTDADGPSGAGELTEDGEQTDDSPSEALSVRERVDEPPTSE